MSPIILICDIPLGQHHNEYFVNTFLNKPCYGCGSRDHSLLKMVETEGLITDYNCPVIIHKPINKYLPAIDTYLDFYIDNMEICKIFDFRFEEPLQNALVDYRKYGTGKFLEEADYTKVVKEIEKICNKVLDSVGKLDATQDGGEMSSK
jgi:hypothetical protein